MSFRPRGQVVGKERLAVCPHISRWAEAAIADWLDTPYRWVSNGHHLPEYAV